MTVLVKYEGPKISLDPVDLWCANCGAIVTRFSPPNERPTSLPCPTNHCEAVIRHSAHKPNLHARLLDFDLAKKELEVEKQTQTEIADQEKLNQELEEQQKAKAESEKQAELEKQKAKHKPKPQKDESGNYYYPNVDGTRDYASAKKKPPEETEEPETPPDPEKSS